MNKINIAELLKDCPKGMELDCTLLEDLEFDGIVDNKYVPIRCRVKNPNGGYYVYNFTKYGCWFNTTFAKCAIFPKGKTTWEGFQRPFKDGDIISNGNTIAIFKKADKPYIYFKKDVVYYHCIYSHKYNEFRAKIDFGIGHVEEFKYATEEEKAKLFQAIKDNGYKWNAETKTLEMLIEPNFKVGDRIVKKNGIGTPILITRVGDEFYYSNTKSPIGVLPIVEQDNYELVPDKFDIATLKPFDKVLVRETNEDRWLIDFYAFYNEIQEFSCVKGMYEQCIPYEGNEHLFLSFDDCDEFYKTWE